MKKKVLVICGQEQVRLGCSRQDWRLQTEDCRLETGGDLGSQARGIWQVIEDVDGHNVNDTERPSLERHGCVLVDALTCRLPPR